MAFLEALGRSRAGFDLISGIQGMQQREQALQTGRTQQAISELELKNLEQEVARGNKLVPIGQMLNQMPPPVRDFWMELGKDYIVPGASGELNIRQKDWPTIKQTLADNIDVKIKTDRLALDWYKEQKVKMQEIMQKAQAPVDAEGKKQKVDEKQIQQLQVGAANIQKVIERLDQSIDILSGQKEKEAALPYKIGSRVKYTGPGGVQFEGTFTGLDVNRRPVFEDVIKVREKPEKPEYTKGQALKRMSQIKAAQARLQAGNPIDALIANLVPEYADLVGSKDPEAIKAVTEQLQTEYDYVSGFAPKTTKSARTTPTKTLDAETARQILNEAGGDRVRARAIAKKRGYKF